MKKRALSIILALCMLISLLPSLSVASASGTTFVYDFNEGLATGTAIKGLKFADTNNIWEWHSSNPVSAATAGAKTHKWGIEASASAAGHWFALKINIPVSGTYSASISHGQSKSAGGYGDVFIIPGDTADVETAIASISPVGKDIAYYNASANVAEVTTPLADVVIEDGKTGEYIIVFKATAVGSTGYRMYPGAVTLTRSGDAPSGGGSDGGDDGNGGDGGEVDVPTGPFVYEFNYNKNIASDKINIKTTYADYSATGNTWMWAGSSASFNVLSYNYNRKWIGTDDADRLYQQISGGYTYGIQIATAEEGAWAAFKLSTPASGKYDVALKYGRHNTGGGYGNVYILPVSTTADIATALATATPINADPISYDSSSAGESAEGTAYADRIANLGRFTVADGEKEHYVVFVATTGSGVGKFQMFPQSITLTENNAPEPEIPEVVYSGYKAVYDFTNGEDDGRNTTYETTNNFWCYDSVSENFETNESSFKKRTYGIQLQGLNGSKWAALAINVPAKDTYKLALDHTAASQGGVAQWYIMPAGTNVAENLGNSKYKLSNTIDFYSETTVTSTTELGDYTFDKAGEYLLVFTYAGNSPNFTGTGAKSAQYITKLTLDGGSKVLPMTLSGSLDGEVSEDTYAPIMVTALMSDGTTSEIEPSKLKFASLDEEIATVDANGNVAGMLSGETTITFETKDGFAKGSINVTVASAGEPQTFFVYDFNEGLTAGAKVNTITEYGAARGLWKYENAKGANVAASVIHKWGFDLRTHALGDWVALRIKVTTAGRYFATLTHGQSATLGGYGNIYILPKNTADISEALKTAVPIGRDVAYFGAANTEAVTTELSAIDLTRGEHILVFEASKKGSTNYRQYPGLLELDSSNIFRTLEFDVDKTEYKIYADGTVDTGKATYSAKLLDGSEIPENEASVVFGSENDSVAECLNGEIVATGHGTTNVYVTVTHNGRTMTRKKEITVTDVSGISSVKVSSDDVNFVGDEVLLSSELTFNSGKSIKPAQDAVTYEVAEGNGEITDGAYVTSSETGIVSVIAKVSFEGEVYESEPYEVIFREPTTKRGPTYFTEARREAARENIAKYSWAREIRDTSVRNSDKLLETYEYLYDHITGEGIPRSNRVGAEGDPDYEKCRYCGNNNVAEYGSRGGGAYEVNIYKDKWKVQCPDCKRRFPSNDFGLLYERGLDEHGYYNNERARKVNAEAVANGEKDALHNDLFPELYDATKESFNKDPMTGATVDGETWGVDDGLGYLPGRTYSNGIEERHGFIAFYTHELWGGVNVAVRDLAESYIYTGEEKYGRAAAVLIDRIADVYPSFSYKQWDNMYLVAHGGSGYGKIYGRINDCDYATRFTKYADAVYPLYNDPQVVRFLSEKAIKYNLENSKTSGEKIWANIEDGLLRDIFKSAKEGNINGNYGQLQGTLAAVALVLDREPESSKIIDWVYQPGAWSQNSSTNTAKNTGGNLSVQLVDVVDRDGAGDEAAPRYNTSWIKRLYDCADILAMYSSDPKYDLYQNPKYAKMFTSYIPLALVDSFTAQIGDSGATASIDYWDTTELLTTGFKGLKDTPLANELAEALYKRNGYTEKGLHYDIYTKNPNRMEQDILNCIDDDLTAPSEMLTGYGFAVLRDGGKYADASHITHSNTLRDFWIYFGRNGGHGHFDTLNLGIEAFGLNFAPDNGYPEVASTDPHRYQWMEPTISHNTVTVNIKAQQDVGVHGYPLHFDDAGEVKVMDIDASNAYAETSIYRRTLLMINAGDDVSYGIDFFRVKGGNDHIYSFHSLSDEIFETEGLENMTYQTDDGTADGNYIGSYAGADVPYGPDPADTYVVADLKCPRGFTWMKNVRKTSDVGKFSVDFKVTDFRKVLRDGSGLHLRMTMLNDFNLNEVTITSGNVPNKSENKELPRTFEYVLARRQGENLDSLYTTVYEPYRHERYISDMTALEMTVAEGSLGSNDVAKAVKVVRTDGRIDYVMYSTATDVLYTVTDGDRTINFRGFAGVYSVNADGEKIYTYVHDGDVIGEETGLCSEYKGTVADFTRELSLENSIIVKTDDDVNVDALKDKYVFVENDAVQNGVYRICGAEKIDGGIKLDIGSVSVIRKYRDSSDTSLGFVYNIAKGQRISIPLSNVNDGSPVFDAINDNLATAAGSTITIALNAECEDGSAITYDGTLLPRGASIDEATGKITWKPTSAQTGKNHFAITARDENGRETTLHFIVTVYGSTTGGASGGGAAPAPTPSKPVEDDKKEDKEDIPVTPVVPSEPSTPSVDESVRFVDLGAHSWAADAINALAEDGVIKGTGENTFSPASNITRADFAILLVRAFKLESDNTENFADVADSDYFAKELAIARNTGIAGGIGDNKYAPRNTITRQDMMTIVYRALTALKIELKTGDVEYADFANVAEYAKDAVSALITSGLVNGKSGKIAPSDYTTRAEVAVLIKRILDYRK